MPDAALIVAIVGAESSGKSTLAQALHKRLSAEGLRCALVNEWLREWCDREGRTPRQDEQSGIAAEQTRRIEAAAASHELVICDTTPLMTAVYSDFIFGDRSLYPSALGFHKRCSATLLTALDLPWLADGHQRQGPEVQAPIDALIRRSLLDVGLAWSIVAGQGEARVEAALDLLTLLLARPDRAAGLFTRLQAQQAAQKPWRWSCEQCDQPECEHRLLGDRPA
ncbi:ATP-binding protein [Pelomonas sp. SE-A7]|uniref:ATP-binding protein n=1 Tax=Pelomonas sp. SE-A7 TaxID=3054953 RepID=UPI00259D0F6D|nr:ATP-binding protein [Pelomonas sp. SE-A7]MDM4765368.1 ATP-binding protein [Pelomonas sp. SE-A7]